MDPRKAWRGLRKLYIKIARRIEVWGFGDFAPERDQVRKSMGDQKGQVSFILNFIFDYENLGLRKGGFFIDLAAGDGIEKSNTYFLEKHLNWDGLLIEANPDFAEQCRAKRRSKVVEECVSSGDGEDINFRLDNGYFGGIVSNKTDNNPKMRGRQISHGRVIRLKSRSLASILDEHESPEVIDYLSLDVEGAEEMILSNFPFDKWTFLVMSIERPTPSLDVLLDANDYIQVAHLDYDVMYVHRSILKQVNFSPKTLFSLTKPKSW